MLEFPSYALVPLLKMQREMREFGVAVLEMLHVWVDLLNARDVGIVVSFDLTILARAVLAQGRG